LCSMCEALGLISSTQTKQNKKFLEVYFDIKFSTL
jgi:hypothetical protein